MGILAPYFFAASQAAAGSLRIALLSEVSVQNDVLVLADLLARGASFPLRNAAQQISLGAAPEFGSTRLISRSAVAEAISSAGLSASQFAIPAVINVRREARLIASQEIFAAIQSAMQNNPDIPNIAPLTPADLPSDTRVPVPPGYSGLQVTQIVFDPLMNRMRFRLLPKAPGKVLPFYITAKLSPGFVPSGSAQSSLPLTGSNGNSSASLAHDAAPLVTTGHPARLRLHSPAMEMILTVHPLQRGYLDQIIRVRLFGTATTMQARVVGPGYLDAIF